MNHLRSLFSSLRTRCSSLFALARKHMVISGLVTLGVLGGGYYAYVSWVAGNQPAHYTLTTARLDSIQETVTGSGQIAASHTLTLSPKASGTVVSVRVKPGQKVVVGTVLATIDATDAQKKVRDAKLALETAELSFKKQTHTTDAVGTALDATASSVTDMESIVTGLNTILTTESVRSYSLQDNATVFGKLAQTPNATTLGTDFESAKAIYERAREAYNNTPRSASVASTQELLHTMIVASQTLGQVAKDILAAARATDAKLIQNGGEPSTYPAMLTSLETYTKTLNADTAGFQSAQNNLADSVIDTSSNDIDLAKARNAYQDALDTLSDYVVRAPFAGTIATVDVQPYDQASASTKVATLITDTSYVELSLSETDAAQVSNGQKAELTFDAIDGLTLSGSVIQVDPVGTVSSGVVSYTAKIGLDSKDIRVKPGMTVNATIVSASKDSALVVPSSAIKTVNGRKYVEVVITMPAEPETRLATSTMLASTTRGMRPLGVSASRARTVSATDVTLT